MKNSFPLAKAARTIFLLGLAPLLASAVTGLVTAEEPAPKETAAKEGWTSLFDGKSLGKWKVTTFSGHSDVEVRDGQIILNHGSDLTGITWSGEVKRMNYELELDAMRVSGHDFFCALTFPVGDDSCSFIAGGWAGSVVGLSSLNGDDASHNETTKYAKFEKQKWYHLRLRVTEGKIEAWIDKEKYVDVETEGKKISIRIEMDKSRPLGIASYATTGALRNIQWRDVQPEAEKPKP